MYVIKKRNNNPLTKHLLCSAFTYDTEDEALAEVRNLIARYGGEYEVYRCTKVLHIVVEGTPKIGVKRA